MNSNTKFQFNSIGTIWWIEIFDSKDESSIETLKQKILDTCKEFEENYSRFKDTSIIGQININKEISNFPEELYEIFIKSKEVYDLTEGKFNIAIAHYLESIGYDKDYSFTKKEEVKIKTWEESILELTKNTIQIDKNIKIDLGGIGKGWLVDKVAKLLLDNEIKYFYINAGGDIYCTSNFEDPVEFALENPFDLTQAIGTIKIKNKGIASSSVNRRRWKDKKTGKEFHHIVAPHEGETSTFRLHDKPPFSVYTEANNTLNADLSSTSIFVTDQALWPQIVKELNCEYLVVFKDGKFLKSEKYSGELFTSP